MEIRFAKMEAPTTVRMPATAMERLLMAPSISPSSSALEVPMAWAEVPSQSFGNGFLDPEKFEHQFCDYISQYTGDNDHCNGNGRNTMKLFRNAYTDRCGNGLWKKRHILFVIQSKGKCQNKNTSMLAITRTRCPGPLPEDFLSRSFNC